MIEVTAKLPDGRILHHTVKNRENIQYKPEFGLYGILDEGAKTVLWVSRENLAMLEQLEED